MTPRSIESMPPRQDSLVSSNSLAKTLDALNEALFWGRPVSQAQKNDAALWIAGRTGVRGSYHGMPAPTAQDIADGARVFTGEALRSRASLCHVLGEEACRMLRQIGVGNPVVEEAYQRAAARIAATMAEKDGKPRDLTGTRLGDDPSHRVGVHCCGMCSASLWRHLAAGITSDSVGTIACAISAPEARLRDGLEALRHQRDKEGKWKPFPFWYTLLILTEWGRPEAVEEMRYAAPVVERSYKRLHGNDKFARRRRDVAERVLRVV